MILQFTFSKSIDFQLAPAQRQLLPSFPLKSLVSHFLSFKSQIKLIYDTVDVCNFVINEFNPTFDVQNMGKEASQNASFGNPSFPNEALSYSCLCLCRGGKGQLHQFFQAKNLRFIFFQLCTHNVPQMKGEMKQNSNS